MDYLSKPGITKAIKDQYDINISDMTVRRYIERYPVYFTDTSTKGRVKLYNPSATDIIKDIYRWVNNQGYDQGMIRKKLSEKYGGGESIMPNTPPTTPNSSNTPPTTPNSSNTPPTTPNIEIMKKLIEIENRVKSNERILQLLFYETDTPNTGNTTPNIGNTPTTTTHTIKGNATSDIETEDLTEKEPVIEPGTDKSEPEPVTEDAGTIEPLIDILESKQAENAALDVEQYIKDNNDIPPCHGGIKLTPETRNACIKQVMLMHKKTADRMDYLNDKGITKANGQPWGKNTQLTNYIYNNITGRKK